MFLKNLENLMIKRNINKRQLSIAVGLSYSAVNYWWLRGCENVSMQTLIKLSKYFNISIDELVNGVPEEEYNYNTHEYSKEELRSINNFANFLKDNR